MKDKRSLHLKVQELCDCYATTDPLKEMSELKKEADKDDVALKWLALATLHGINSNAKKITVTRSEDGEVNVTAEYRVAELPSPGGQIRSGCTPPEKALRQGAQLLWQHQCDRHGRITRGHPG